MSKRMGRLRGSSGEWLEGDGAMVDGLVGDVFGRQEGFPGPCDGEGLRVDFPYSRKEVRQWVLHALGRTKSRSAPGPDGIGYWLI